MPIIGDKHEFSEESIERAPDKPGVYALYKGSVLVYIGRASGKSNSIRARLRAHFLGQDDPSTQTASYFRYEVTSNPSLRERQLLMEYRLVPRQRN